MENEENLSRKEENDKHDEENAEDLVTIFSTDSEGIAAVVKSILEEAGIQYNVKGEGIQSMYGIGVLGPGGLSPTAEPIEFQVIEDDAERAIELLKDVEESEPTDRSLPPSEISDQDMDANENLDDDK